MLDVNFTDVGSMTGLVVFSLCCYEIIVDGLKDAQQLVVFSCFFRFFDTITCFKGGDVYQFSVPFPCRILTEKGL